MTAPRVHASQDSSNFSCWTFTYEEDGRSWSLQWDWREDWGFARAMLDAWDTPPGEPIDEAARERILDAVWPALSGEGKVQAIIDESRRLRCPVAVRWSRGPDGFLIDISDGGQIDYMELARTMRLSYLEPEPNHAVVQWPATPRWTEPDGPVDAEAVGWIRQRLQYHGQKDRRIGAHLEWRVDLAGGGTA